MKFLALLPLILALFSPQAWGQTFEVDTSKYFAYFKMPDKITARLRTYAPYILLSNERCQAKGVKNGYQGLTYWPQMGQTRNECWREAEGIVIVCPVGDDKTGSVGNACVEISKSRFADTASLPKAASFPKEKESLQGSQNSSKSTVSNLETDKAKCRDVLKNHGFLSRGQFQCGFANYSDEMMAVARACSEIIPENERKKLLLKGFELFDQNAKRLGKETQCMNIKQEFPHVYD